MGMQTMKFDMCGAANVVGMIDAVSKLSLPVNIEVSLSLQKI